MTLEIATLTEDLSRNEHGIHLHILCKYKQFALLNFKPLLCNVIHSMTILYYDKFQ